MSLLKIHTIIAVSLVICTMLNYNFANAQISGATSCTGSLGSPIVNETFGSGIDIGPPLDTSITNMEYVHYTCPNDGQYTIANFTTGCFRNSWYTLKDHTGDANGYFMLINASQQPSDFFVQTVAGLCGGSSYQFSAWVMNIDSLPGIMPNITFTIEKTDKTVLATYSTGNIPVVNAATWKQYGFYFTTPPGIFSVVLRMHNNAPGGGGNDLALDDIVFRPAGPTTTVNIQGVTGDTTSICNSGLHFSSAEQSCNLTNSLQWQFSANGVSGWTDIAGQTNTTYDMPQSPSGTYFYRLAVAQSANIGNNSCRINSQPITVIVSNVTPVYDSKQVVICAGNLYTLPSGKKVGVTGVYIDTLPSVLGCDSLVTTATITVNNVKTVKKAVTICRGDFYTMPSGKMIGATGIYSDTLYYLQGCDSLITTIDLAVGLVAMSNINDSYCEGSFYTLPSGKTTSTVGIYIDTLYNSKGCDSVIRTVNLSEILLKTQKLQAGLCKGNYLTLPTGKRVAMAGNYLDTLRSKNGCDSLITILSVVTFDAPTGFLVRQAVKCVFEPIILYPESVFLSYKWNTGSTDRIVTIKEPGTYWLEVTDSNNCISREYINVIDSVCAQGVFVPSGFTPNGDGKNDLFRPIIGEIISQYHFIIYNRWGQKVFESKDPAKGWDGLINGVLQGNGVYVWQLFLILGNGSLVNKKGTVVLIR